ncbi:glycosyltransferase [Limnohabitans sp.]
MKVLCIADYYLPGFLGGGPITTLANIRKMLSDRVVMDVFTRDRDLNNDLPYPKIKINEWNNTVNGKIFYSSPKYFGPRGLLRVLGVDCYDIVYMNSFFSLRGSIMPHFVLPALVKGPRVLIAPRGEFSEGALKIKKFKKLFYIFLARHLNLYGGVFWHASTVHERDDILRFFPGAKDRIFIAADPVVVDEGRIELLSAPLKKTDQLRMVFLSRVSPMKNLDGLLKILTTVSLPVRFDIFGPVEDVSYWARCTKLITELPRNIVVTFHGAVKPDAVSRIFAEYDLFAFPTHGENFGHVIFESLRVGTPVLVSDQTPWQQDDEGGLTVIPLHDEQSWRNAIEMAAHRTNEAQQAIRYAARNYAVRYASQANTKQENLNLFLNVLSY